VSSQAKGSFDVKTIPLPADSKDQEAGLVRFGGEKQYHGDLEATAKLLMLAAGDYAKGTAGYVAIEKVTGSLQGRTGTFVLQHSATLDHGAQQISIVVVPGTGTDQLDGLRGTLKIIVGAEGKHSYEFDYTLPAQR